MRERGEKAEGSPTPVGCSAETWQEGRDRPPAFPQPGGSCGDKFPLTGGRSCSGRFQQTHSVCATCCPGRSALNGAPGAPASHKGRSAVLRVAGPGAKEGTPDSLGQEGNAQPGQHLPTDP